MRIAICEDEPMYVTVLQRIIQQWAATQSQVIEIETYENAEAFIRSYGRDEHVDLAFLDIQMGGMSGLELAKWIRQRDMRMMLVFVTSFTRYILDGYSVFAFDFLLKPVKEKKVLDVLSRALELHTRRNTNCINIKTDIATLRIAKADIVYVASRGHYLNIYTFDEEHKTRMKLSSLSSDLTKPMFTKCIKGVLVNVEHITCIRKDQVDLANGHQQCLSRSCWEDLNRCYLSIHVDPDVRQARYEIFRTEGKPRHAEVRE